MKKNLQNIKKVFSKKSSFLSFFVGASIIAFPSYYFFEGSIIKGYLGYGFYISEIVTAVLISLLFGFFLAITLYKIGSFSKKTTGVGTLAGFFGVIVSGCPACTITLASYIGLAGVLSAFPLAGMELKVLSVFMLLYACISTLKNLEVCAIKKN